MSRPSSRIGRSSSVSSSPLNDVVRRSRALTNTVIAYGSRSSSREPSRGRRGSISNEYKRRSISLDRATRFDDMIAQAGGVPRPTRIRRWDGNCRTTTNWDCLRKDPELWFSNGDCLVHFYGEHDPRRGASFRLWLADIQSSNCAPLLRDAVCRPYHESGSDSDVSGSHSRHDPLPSYDLFIPAPHGSRHEDAANYHLTTRNFFAWMFEKPIVGVRLGEALCGLLDRMNRWRPDPEENEDDFLAYIDDQGYTDFRDCPDHALALLHWAEVYQYTDLWIDAFVHCTGMNEQLVGSQEFSSISITTKAMITRANLDIAVRMDRASAQLADFCEADDIFNRRLKLSSPTLAHLDRFRAFLQSFYVQRHGYWPPHIMKTKFGKVRPLPKHTLLTMYTDFRNLYEFMVNTEADPFMQPEMSRSVVDVLTTFDEEMKFTPLPHLIPHLPSVDFKHGELRKTRSAFNLFRSKKTKYDAQRAAVASAITVATNVSDLKVISSAIVREYALFERDYTLQESERITASEARMARWVLIYALLQILISVTNAPDEVRDVEGVDYPLCAHIFAGPPWKANQKSRDRSSRRRSQSLHSSSRRQSVAPGVQARDFAQFMESRSVVSPAARPRTSPNGSTSGPPPSAPPPLPMVRAPSRAEQAAARGRSATPASRIPVLVRAPSRASNFSPKPSRIPVPISRSTSRAAPASLEVIDDPTAMEYLSDYDVEKTSGPIIPPRSLRRSPPGGSPITTIPDASEPGSPPPLSAKSARRQSVAYQEHLEQIEAIHGLSVNTNSDSSPVPASSPSVSPISTKDEYFGTAPVATMNFSLPISSIKPAVSLIQAAPRGRSTTRVSRNRSRRGSDTSSTSDMSSGTEKHTIGSRITTPSLYTPSHFGERFVKSRQSDTSTSKEVIEEIPPLPTTPATPHSDVFTMATSIYTLAPEDPITSATIAASDEEYPAETQYPPRSTSRALSTRPLESPPITKGFATGPLARFSLHRPVNDATSQANAMSAPYPTIGPLQPRKSIHETGKTHRLRFLRSHSDEKQSTTLNALNPLRQNRPFGLASLVPGRPASRQGSIVPVSMPTSAMAIITHDEPGEVLPRPGTALGRPGHARRYSSELAKQFRNEIGWKRGAGWDEDVDGLIMGKGNEV